MNEFLNWVRARTTNQRHVIKLGKPKAYFDADEMLMLCFEHILTDFVEIDCAWMHIWCYEDEKAFRTKRFLRRVFGFNMFRDAERGLKYLLEDNVPENSERNQAYEKIAAAYKIFKDDIPKLQKEMDSIDDDICNRWFTDEAVAERKLSGEKVYTNPDYTKLTNKQQQIYKKIKRLKKTHMKNVIDSMDHMWV